MDSTAMGIHTGEESQLQSGWLSTSGRCWWHWCPWDQRLVFILGQKNLTTSLCKADFPSVGIPKQFPACPHSLQPLPTSGAFTWVSPSFCTPNLFHLTLFMLFNISLLIGFSLPQTFPAPKLFLLPLSPPAGSRSGALDPSPPLKVVRILLCDVLACSRLMIPSRFASSAHFLCLLLLCVPRSLMQMSSRIFFEAETQGTVWVSPSQCDTAPFS